MKRLIATTLVALSLIAPATASASETLPFPGQHVTTDPLLLAIRDRAADYWSSKGIRGCVPTFYVADTVTGTDAPNAVGRGDVTNCSIVVSQHYINLQMHYARQQYKYETYRWRLRLKREGMAIIVAVIEHETGHARGLEHTNNGSIMDPTLTADAFCFQIARKLIPRTDNRKVTNKFISADSIRSM
jgi:hypothetical protein